MKINITTIGMALLALGICIWSAQVRAQTSTTVTTTKGAFTEYVPGSQTVVMRTETNPDPSRYVVTKQTTIVDESGAPVAIERISAGSPVAIEYTGTGERLIVSRIVVQRPAAVTAPVTTAPVTTQDTATTTTTTRPLTQDEKHELKEQREHRKEALKEEIEKEKDALEEAKDKLDDDD
jgi:thiol:disulfide interchange protein